jgi:ABC-type multidrug transport system fused ATPase/permease subunit
VRENITYGRPDARDEAVREAARRAQADEFIEQLEHGYDTPVCPCGGRPSGGQRDIVVSFIGYPRLVGTETRIRDAPGRLPAGRTALIVAHRLETIRGADLIVALDAGRIVKQGATKSCSPPAAPTPGSIASGPRAEPYA